MVDHLANARHEAFIATVQNVFNVMVQSVLLNTDSFLDAIDGSPPRCSLFCLTGSVGQIHRLAGLQKTKGPSEQILWAVADQQTRFFNETRPVRKRGSCSAAGYLEGRVEREGLG